MAALPRFGLWYDFRNPVRWHRPFEEIYSQYLDQIATSEDLGFGSVWLTEHHFLDDGYTPSPLILAAAIGQRTRAMQIATNLLILPLHDPVRIAEDAATLSLLTGGRFDLGVGIGYKEVEFAQFGRDIRHRPSLIEEAVSILRRAWAGERIDFKGKRFLVHGHRITPQPQIAPRIFMGGSAPAAIERAARLGDGFLPAGTFGIDAYLATSQAIGARGSRPAIMHGSWAIISADPEAEAVRLGPHLLYQTNLYRSWGAWGPPEAMPPLATPDEAIEQGPYEFWDGPQAVRELQTMIDAYPELKDIHFWAQFPGESVESGQRRIEYIAHHVIPNLRPSPVRANAPC